MVSDEALLYYNDQGLIPGPLEPEGEFESRARYCLNLKEILAEEMPFALKDAKELMEEMPLLQESFSITRPLYGIAPDWIVVFFSDEKLLPWHGGAAWIFQVDDNSPTSAILQLRKAFFKKDRYLGVLKRNDLVAHELCHAGRMAFEEPIFEEVLAYRSSSSWFSRNLGPLIESSMESIVFVLTLALAALVDFFIVLYGTPEMFWKAFWIKLIPLGLVAYAGWRLTYKMRTFSRCLSKLTSLYGSDLKANAVIYRLTDGEIQQFAQASVPEIKDYIQNQNEIRWRAIRLAY